MSGTTNLQNVLANIIRPVHVYDPATSNYSTKVVISNVDTFSVNTIEVENLEFGDGLGNVYLGIDAGSENATSARNVALGVGAAQNNINATDSVFLGYQAGGQDIRDVSGTIAIGSSSRAGGSSNVYIGVGTGSSNSNATGNIFLGPLITAGAVSNQLRIGRGSTIPISANITSGFVGVNTLDAAYPLDVSGSATTTAQFRNTGGQASVRVTGGGGADATGLSLYQTASAQGLSSSNALPLTLSTANTGRLTILSNGAVGIGTTTPTQTLDVGGTTQTTNAIVGGFLRNALTPSQFDLSSGTLFLSNRVLTGAGTAAAPAYSFSGDTAMGLFDPATNVLGVATAGLERLRVTSNGFVGIGTTAPEFLLDVSGSVRATNFVGTTGSATFGGVLLSNGAVAVANGSVSVPTMTFQNDLSLGLFRTGANQLGFVSAGLPRMTLSNGNLGIGTATPAQTLDVVGTTQTSNLIVPGVLRNSLTPTQFDISGGNQMITGGLFLNSTDTAKIHFLGDATRGVLGPRITHSSGFTLNFFSGHTSNNNEGNFTFNRATTTGSAESMRITRLGDVGIGTATPAARLDVSGAGRFQSDGQAFLVSDRNAFVDIVNAGGSYGGLNMNGYFTIQAAGTTNKASSNTLVQLAPELNSANFIRGNNTGFGTTAPGAVVDVSGTGLQIVARNNSGQSSVTVAGVAAPLTDGIQLYHNASEMGLTTSNQTLPMRFYTANLQRMSILSNGNVGIGATAPDSRMEVTTSNIRVLALQSTASTSPAPIQTTFQPNLVTAGPSNYTYRFFGVSSNTFGCAGEVFTYFGVGNSNNSMRWYIEGAGGVAGTTLLANGNFGVGTMTPARTLDVAGTTQTSNLIVPGFFRNALTPTQFDLSSGKLRLFGETQAGQQAMGSFDDIMARNNIRSDVGSFVGVSESQWLSANTDFPLVVSQHMSNGVWTIKGAGNGDGGLAFKTRVGGVNAERMRIHTNGFLGIGTRAPVYPLDVSGSVGRLAVFSNTGGQAGITVVGNGVAESNGFAMYHESSEMGLYTNSAGPFHVWTSNVRRMTILGNGNVGIRTTTPGAGIQFHSNPLGVYNPAYNSESNMILLSRNGFRVETNATSSQHLGNLYLFTDLSLSPTNNSAGAVLFGANNNEFGGYNVAYGRIAGVKTGSFRGGLSFSTMYDQNDGLLRENMRIINGNVGIGTSAPDATLDVSGGGTFTGIFRNPTGQVVVSFAGNNTSVGQGLYILHNTTEQGLYTPSSSIPLTFTTGNARRVTITGAGNMGIGQPTPGYRLDVASEGPTLATVNMTTWSRQSVSNVLIVRGNVGIVTNTVNWSNATQSINSSLMTFTSSNATLGSSFVILRSGVWSIVYHAQFATNQNYVWIDVSTNNVANVAVPAVGSPIVALSQPAGTVNTLTWTGYLPSNATWIYKTRSINAPSVTNSNYFMATFLYETPNAGGNFPFF